jgi:phage regulator Rha-like protein
MQNLVIKTDNELLTDSIIVASGCDIQHKNVIGLIRKYEDDFKEFGALAFETRKGESLPQGGFAKSTEYALLNEDQATYLITLFRNNDIVRGFKKRLVHEFRRLINENNKSIKRRGELSWKESREHTALEYKVMSATLQEVRKLAGKDTKSHHYINEAKLLSFSMTGSFKGLNREELNSKELQVLKTLEVRNAVLIGAGLEREVRKKALVDLYSELTINRLE